MNGPTYSHPIYRASADDPVAIVRQSGRPEERYRIPDGAVPAQGNDRHMHVVDPSGRWANETWKMQGSNPAWTARYHVLVDLHSVGFGAGTRASGASALGGLIRNWELDAGEIRHAIAIAITSSQLSKGFTWPANRTDANAGSNSGPVPMGTYAAIPSSVDIASLGLSAEGQAIGRAMQLYGVYVVDRASDAFVVFAEPNVSGPVVTRLRTALATLRPHLRVVANNGPGTVNGGGTRSVRAVPPFAS